MPLNKAQLLNVPGGPGITGAVKSGNGVTIDSSTGSTSLNAQQTILKLSAGTNVSLNPPSGVGVVTITNTLAAPGAGGDFPSGTRMIFANSSAPVGWTTVGEFNNLAVRLNNTGGSTTNSAGFDSIFTSYTTNGNASLSDVTASGDSSTFDGTYSGSISISGNISNVILAGNQNADHTHVYTLAGTGSSNVQGGPNEVFMRSGTDTRESNGVGQTDTHSHAPSISASFSGTNNSHFHTVSGSLTGRQVPLQNGNTINLNVQYLNFLTCSLT